MNRGSGILLPVFSLSSRYGIGTFGKESHSFVLFLEKAGQTYWQMLPLNPTSYGDSPYQSFSAFALNPYFIDLDELVKEGILTPNDLKNQTKHYESFVDYGRLYVERFKVLRTAYNKALKTEIRTKLDKFLQEENKWLIDYSMFMVIKGMHGGKSWQEWEDKYKKREDQAMKEVFLKQEREFYFWVFLQYEAYKQYRSLKKYAASHHIKIIGDIPIYVALDSSDVWANSELFQLDKNRRPTSVAGVPPDYFSATGQLWGNPLYDYEKMEKDGFSWWKYRIQKCSELYDVLRIDHFRGIDEYWSVPYGEETAINGKWIKGPNMKLVNALQEAAPNMQFIAEDLGLLTPTVTKLKLDSTWPGMKVYEFAFDSGYSNAFLPINYESNCVAYIGTHDNDTLAHFIEENTNLHPFMKEYLHVDDVKYIHDTMIGTLMRSNADTVILMLQDLLHVGQEGRINLPGTLGMNWKYRLPKDVLTNELAKHLRIMTEESGRLPK